MILETAGRSIARAEDVRDAINAAHADNKSGVLIRVKSGGSSLCRAALAERLRRARSPKVSRFDETILLSGCLNEMEGARTHGQNNWERQSSVARAMALNASLK